MGCERVTNSFQCPYVLLLTLGYVLIIGDSIVRWATGQLNVDVNVVWQGRSGACMGVVFPMLSARHGTDPAVLIIYIGTNDLINTDEFCMRQRILLLLNSCTVSFPNMVLIWSAILP